MQLGNSACSVRQRLSGLQGSEMAVQNKPAQMAVNNHRKILFAEAERNLLERRSWNLVRSLHPCSLDAWLPITLLSTFLLKAKAIDNSSLVSLKTKQTKTNLQFLLCLLCHSVPAVLNPDNCSNKFCLLTIKKITASSCDPKSSFWKGNSWRLAPRLPTSIS